MGQLFTLAPVLAGFCCGGSNHGTTKAILPRYPASLIPLLTFSHWWRSFPLTLSLGVSVIRKAEGKGGLRYVQ